VDVVFLLEKDVIQMDARVLTEDFVPEADFAAANNINPRTSKRYRDAGMPYLEWGGRIYINVPGAKKFVEARVRRANPRRGA
jgi:hypothetical protein